MSSAANYSALDRLLHRIALGNLELQKSIADMEDRMHSSSLRRIAIERPVFITSLPRAGTTLLLEFIVNTGEFASHTYRDMPFVLCPLTWRSISGRFQNAAKPRERAHGDGVMVGFDSPEAFEEVIWKAFWPGKYAANGIKTWTACDREPEFEIAFGDHMRKIIAIRSEPEPKRSRYVSKNNANIARLGLLPALFGDCRIVIPFRNPSDHSRSLARQHANFLDLHARDRFARSYMEWIGHYEFGAAFRPFDFCPAPPTNVADEGYWLEYWCGAYTHILQQAPPQAIFVDYDELCSAPRQVLEKLELSLAVDDQTLRRQFARLRKPAADNSGALPRSTPESERIYGQLLQRSL